MSTPSILFANAILCLSVPCTSTAQDVWLQTNGPYQGGAVQALAVDSDGQLFAGTREGGVFSSFDRGENWIQINAGLPDDIQCLAIHNDGHIFAGTFGFGIFRSTGNGERWTRINNGLTDTFVSTLTVSSSGDIFAGTLYGGAFFSLDEGDLWTEINKGLDWRNVEAFVMNVNGQAFAGMGRGGVYRFTNDDEGWQKLITNFESYAVTALAFNSRGHLFAAVDGGGGFHVSRDNGETWMRVHGGYEPSNIVALVINRSDEIFAGTIGGVFRSGDDGYSWTAWNAGLTDRLPLSLVMDQEEYLFAGTTYGGVYRSINPPTGIEVQAIEGLNSFSLDQNYPNPFNPETRIVFYVSPGSEKQRVLIKIYDLLGRLVAVLFDREVKPGRYEVVWNGKDLLGQDLPSGTYLYHLEAGNVMVTKRMTLLR